MASCFLGANVGSDDEYSSESDAAEDFGESNIKSRRAEFAYIPRELLEGALEAMRTDEINAANADAAAAAIGIGGAVSDSAIGDADDETVLCEMDETKTIFFDVSVVRAQEAAALEALETPREPATDGEAAEAPGVKKVAEADRAAAAEGTAKIAPVDTAGGGTVGGETEDLDSAESLEAGGGDDEGVEKWKCYACNTTNLGDAGICTSCNGEKGAWFADCPGLRKCQVPTWRHLFVGGDPDSCTVGHPSDLCRKLRHDRLREIHVPDGVPMDAHLKICNPCGPRGKSKPRPPKVKNALSRGCVSLLSLSPSLSLLALSLCLFLKIICYVHLGRK